MNSRPEAINLSNWRNAPYSRWSFQHVREIVPSANIATTSSPAKKFIKTDYDLGAISIKGSDSENWTLDRLHEKTSCDAFLVAHQGKLVHEWYAQDSVESNPHIVFSISKSITAMLAGVLVGQGLLDPAAQLCSYLPELENSAYKGCTLQQLLDMAVSLDFEELYDAIDGKFIEYRVSTGWHPARLEDLDFGMHEFLKSLKPGSGNHGEQFSYKSPNSDLLGWIIERAAGRSLADLFSKFLWQPMDAEADAYITVDRKGAARAAGGFCALPRDLLRFAELVRNKGRIDGREVIPELWIDDCFSGGNGELWRKSLSAEKFSKGSYRNKWYQTGNAHGAIAAIGIHGQWIFIDPLAEVVIVKLSSQSEPLNPSLALANIRAFEVICEAYR